MSKLTPEEIQQRKAYYELERTNRLEGKNFLLRQRKAIRDAFKLHFVHRLPEQADDEMFVPKCSGMTIAWCWEDNGYEHNPSRSIILVSTALCHPRDNYSKKIGEAYAALAMDRGNFISLKVPTVFRKNVSRFLELTFSM